MGALWKWMLAGAVAAVILEWLAVGYVLLDYTWPFVQDDWDQADRAVFLFETVCIIAMGAGFGGMAHLKWGRQ